MVYNNPYILSDQISEIFKGASKKLRRKIYVTATASFNYL